MVEVIYQNRLGNRLFQYSLGRIIAESLRYDLRAEPIDGFPGTRTPVTGFSYEAPVRVYQGHRLSLESMLLDPAARKIELRGWFQNYRYYAPHADRIRQWLDTGSARADHGEFAKDVLLNIRLGDLLPLGQAIAPDYYRTLLKRLTYRRAYMITDEPSHPMINELTRLGVTLLPLDAANAFRVGKRFGTLVIGQGTFAWWLAFLSGAKQVHVAIPEHRKIGSFSVSRIAHGMDLRVDDERYFYYYRAPLFGEPNRGELRPLGDLCGCHRRSKAFLWT